MAKYEYYGELQYRYSCIVEADTEEEALEKAEAKAYKHAQYEDTNYYEIKKVGE